MTAKLTNLEAAKLVEDYKADFDHVLSTGADFESYELAMRCLAIQDRIAAIALSDIINYVLDRDAVEEALFSVTEFDEDVDIYKLVNQLYSSIASALMYT